MCLTRLYWFITVVMCVVVSSASGQAKLSIHKLDSLRQSYEKLSGPDKVDKLNNLAYAWLSYNPEKINEISNETLDPSDKLKYDKGKSEALIHKGTYEWYSGHIVLSMDYYKEGIRIARKMRDGQSEGLGLLQYAGCLVTLGKNDSASLLYFGATSNFKKQEELLSRSLQIREVLQDNEMLADIYLALASANARRGNYVASSSCLSRASEYIRSIDPEHRLHRT